MNLFKTFNQGYFGNHDRFPGFYGEQLEGQGGQGHGLGSWFNKLMSPNDHNSTNGNFGWFSHLFHS